jgi:hypothetical protein
MQIVRLIAVLALFLGAMTTASAQKDHITWAFSVQNLPNNEANLVITGTLEPGWVTYSQTLESDLGPVPTTITWTTGPHFTAIGKAEESGGLTKAYDKIFDINVTKFKGTAVFTQKVKITDKSKPVTGSIEYMLCNEEMCLPPKLVNFTIPIR